MYLLVSGSILRLHDDSRRISPASADSSELQQLLMNLFINAVESIGAEGGRIRIVTRPAQLDESYLRTLLGSDRARPGQFVLLEMQDTGAGIDDPVMARIFDPF